MALTQGTRLGPYDIISTVGAGGMGQVYRARDTRLDRDVAIKVLPPAFAADADRRARFERETKAVAALSHPNVIAIFDTGLHEGQLFAVTELLEGETLRAALDGGPLSVRKAIDIAVQISRGLTAAHDKGIIHRDLKPENVFLLRDGQVKILDFGLARSVTPPADTGVTAGALTSPGTVMGTAGYMAPEQVRGLETDARTDLFALGAVLYEMLSGRRAFQGDTPADTMFAVVKNDPPELPPIRADVSPALDRIVRHCLEKTPIERFQSARDVAFALQALSGTNVSPGSGPLLPETGRRVWRWGAALGLIAATALVTAAIVGRTSRNEASRVTFTSKTWEAEWITNARFAPDGQTIVFSAARSGNVPQLFVVRSGTMIPQAIGDPATQLLSMSSKGELAVLTSARLSPAGHRVFLGTLARMTMDGASRPWLERVSEADWSPDGSTMAIIRWQDGGGMQLEYPIGRVLVRKSTGSLTDLRVSPDGSRVAFFDHQALNDDRGWVRVVDSSGTVSTLAGEYYSAEGLAWTPDGRSVVFAASTGGAESIQPLIVNAAGTPAVRQVLPTAGGMLVMDAARDGRLLVLRNDARASIRALLPGEEAEREFAWLNYAVVGYLSRDLKSLVFTDQSQSAGANYAVALRDLGRGTVVKLGEGMAGLPSPDGKWASAMIFSTGQIVFYPTGPGEPQKLARGPIEHYQQRAPGNVLDWLPDARRVFFCGNETGKAPRCYEQDIAAGAPKPVTPEGISGALLAPDGRTLLATDNVNAFQVLTLGGGAASPARGLNPDDFPVAWTSDSRGVIVSLPVAPARIERVDPFTGTRTPLTELGPPDLAGVNIVVPSQWIDDGRGYVYTYGRELSKLFVASGVRY